MRSAATVRSSYGTASAASRFLVIAARWSSSFFSRTQPSGVQPRRQLRVGAPEAHAAIAGLDAHVDAGGDVQADLQPAGGASANPERAERLVVEQVRAHRDLGPRVRQV